MNILVRTGLPLLGAITLFASTGPLHAQTFHGELGLTVGLPQGAFGDTVDNTGYGPTIALGYAFEQLPLMIGIEGTYLIYGTESRREHFNPNIPEVDVTVRTTNAIASGMLFARVGPQSGVVRPFVEGVFGIQGLVTTSSVSDDYGHGESSIASTTNHSDVVMGYGAGAGLTIQLFENTTIDTMECEPQLRSVTLELRGRYTSSEEGEYLVNGAIRRSGGQISCTPSRSRVDMLALYAGVAVNF